MRTVAAGARDGSGGSLWVRPLVELVVWCGVGLGGAYLTSYVAGRLGLATSRGLIFESTWFAPSWAHFPWMDAAGMLAFMFLLPWCWGRFPGVRMWMSGLGGTRRALILLAIALVPGASIYLARHVGNGAFSQTTYIGSLVVLSSYWFVVAMAEEAWFRGVLQERLEAVAGLPAALAVATTAFVLWHGVGGSGATLLFRAAAGLGLGLLYRGSRSLVPPIVCHWVLNMALAA